MDSLQLTDSELKLYSELFTSCDVDNNSNKVSGAQAADLFFKSGLSSPILHQITDLCGAKRLGHFGRSQFYIALKLISLAQAGYPVSMESLHTNDGELSLPKFDAVQDYQSRISPHPVQNKGALPPPPSKNHVRSISGHNILSIVDTNPAVSGLISPRPAPVIEKISDQGDDGSNGVRRPKVRLTHHQSISMPVRQPPRPLPKVPQPPPSQKPVVSTLEQAFADVPTTHLSTESTEGVVDEEDVEQEHEEENDGFLNVESQQWMQFSDDDRGLISDKRKSDWSAVDAVDNSMHEEQRRTARSSSASSSSSDSDSSSSTSSSEHSEAVGGGEAGADGGSSPLYSPLDGHYGMSKEQRDYYTSCFRTLQPHTDGQLGGHTAKRFFEISNLPATELAHIWQLADLNRDGQLNLEEFCIAMHLVVLRKNDVALPDTLPSALLPDEDQLQNEEPFSADLADPGEEDSVEEVFQAASSTGPTSLESDQQLAPAAPAHLAEHLRRDQRGSGQSPELLFSQRYPPSVLGKSRSESLSNEAASSHSDVIKSRPRPTPRKKAATLPTGLLPPPIAAPPPPPPPRSRLVVSGLSRLAAGGEALSPTASSPLSRPAEHPNSPQLDSLLRSGSLDKRQLKFLIRQEKQRNHTLLRLNNELSHELKEVMEQRVNLGIQLNHLRPLNEEDD